MIESAPAQVPPQKPTSPVAVPASDAQPKVADKPKLAWDPAVCEKENPEKALDLLGGMGAEARTEEDFKLILNGLKACKALPPQWTKFYRHLVDFAITARKPQAIQWIEDDIFLKMKSANDADFDYSLGTINQIANYHATQRPYPFAKLIKIHKTLVDKLLERPATSTIGLEAKAWVGRAQDIMESSGRLGHLATALRKFPDLAGARAVDQATFSMALCRADLNLGKTKDCLAVVDRFQKLGDPQLSQELTLMAAQALAEAGDFAKASAKLAPILNSSDVSGQVWAHLTQSYIDVNSGQLERAKKQLDEHFKKFKTIYTPYPSQVNLFGKMGRLSYLRAAGDFGAAKKEGDAILQSLSAEYNGTPIMACWVRTELMLAAAQQKNQVEFQLQSSELKKAIAELPDCAQRASFIPAVEAAMKGQYSPSLLNSARTALGGSNLTLKKVESAIATIKK